MQKGFSKLESIAILIIMIGIILLGTIATLLIFWPLAILCLGTLCILWFHLHRTRVCNFCDQNCPFNLKNKDRKLKQKGFTVKEALTFYPLTFIILVIFITAIFKLNIIIGMITVILLAAALTLYRIKICINCKIPCPINPNKTKK